MSDYNAPLADMRFVLGEIAGLKEIADLPGYEEATPDLAEAILTEAGRLAKDVLAPLNRTGDQEGCTLENGAVRMPKGFPEAYRLFVEGGWGSLPFDPEHGGQGLPWTLSIAVQEMWSAANLSFSLAPLLTQGAVESLQVHGTAEQKTAYLPNMISGRWSGTMNLTEPQAGSDVGALKTRAVKQDDHYLITGQKIFITWGDHDCAENIVHMVLARTPDAPAGTRGISLFIVPKFLPKEDGTLGARNDLRCVSLEHKLGIHASPTAVMAYGDSGGAIGYLLGEENQGMACMFTMMNNARISVGVQGLAIAERAYQQARDFARERIQSRAIDSKDAGGVAIIQHPDVRRTLMTMKASVEAMRALAYLAAATLDKAKRAPEAGERAAAQARIDLLTPLVKSWLTDCGCEIASLGVQVHGGMGFIEESGAAQHYRDARILPIYEGTNGIQAMDLVCRKLPLGNGDVMQGYLAELDATVADVAASNAPDFGQMAERLAQSVDALRRSSEWMAQAVVRRPEAALAGATDYLRVFGLTAGAVYLARGALYVQRQSGDDGIVMPGKRYVALARYFAEHLSVETAGLATSVMSGGDAVLMLSPGQLSA